MNVLRGGESLTRHGFKRDDQKNFMVLAALSLGLIYALVTLASVAEPEPEPVEQQLFAGAGAKVFLARLRSRVCKFL
jgi:hypothetical protein